MTEHGPEFNQDTLDLIAEFAAAGVEYVVVGAHAMAVHGVPRATGDIDVLVRASEGNAARVIEALTAFGAPLQSHGVGQCDFESVGRVYQMGLPPRRIDLLTSLSGVSFDAAARDAVVLEIDGHIVPFMGLDALIENKRATGREKDNVDLQLLLVKQKS